MISSSLRSKVVSGVRSGAKRTAMSTSLPDRSVPSAMDPQIGGLNGRQAGQKLRKRLFDLHHANLYL